MPSTLLTTPPPLQPSPVSTTERFYQVRNASASFPSSVYIESGERIVGWYNTAGGNYSNSYLHQRALAQDENGRQRVRRGFDFSPVVECRQLSAGSFQIHAATACSICGSHPQEGSRFSAWDESLPDNAYICNSCAMADSYVRHAEQGTWIRREYAVQNTDTGEWLPAEEAQNCWHYWEGSGEWHTHSEDSQSEYEDASSDEPIFSYHTNSLEYVKYDRRAMNAGALLYGVELEMEPKPDQHRRAQQALAEALNGPSTDNYILTTDGSLDYGIELVHAPRTLAQHQNDGVWKAISDSVRGIAMSGAGTEHCGMHVHINRKALSPLTLGKMLVFYNDERMNRYICMIAQRQSNGYSTRKDKAITDALEDNRDRYERLNMNRRIGTVEVRIFRGNLRVERILKNIEFVDASVNYCRQCSIEDASSWHHFAEWLRLQTRTYPHLIAYLRERSAAGFGKTYRLPRKILELTTDRTEA